jgi:hypothetical protein
MAGTRYCRTGSSSCPGRWVSHTTGWDRAIDRAHHVVGAGATGATRAARCDAGALSTGRCCSGIGRGRRCAGHHTDGHSCSGERQSQGTVERSGFLDDSTLLQRGHCADSPGASSGRRWSRSQSGQAISVSEGMSNPYSVAGFSGEVLPAAIRETIFCLFDSAIDISSYDWRFENLLPVAFLAFSTVSMPVDPEMMSNMISDGLSAISMTRSTL